MKLVTSIAKVADTVNRAKTGAPAFVTNFYTSSPRLQTWIEHGEILLDAREKVVFLFRKDRSFLHFFFSASDLESLGDELASLPETGVGRLTTDVVGSADGVESVLQVLQSRGFVPVSRLVRLCRQNAELAAAAGRSEFEIDFALAEEAPAVLNLLEELFDPVVYQVPALYEVETAVRLRQVLVIRRDDNVCALLLFETLGVSSTLRFWAVSPHARAAGMGAALLRRYFQIHSAVRRFILWVDEKNQNARDKYARFGYVPDGLFDHILVSPSMLK